MKKITLLFVFLVTAATSKPQINSANDPGASMLKVFYTAYMSAFSAPDEPPHHFQKVLDELRKQYLTKKCEIQYEKLVAETDADPIINAQDSDAKWAKTLLVKWDNRNTGRYTVSYYDYEYRADRKLHKIVTKIRLIVVKTNGNYKISRILP
jgi:hypothetical protein